MQINIFWLTITKENFAGFLLSSRKSDMKTSDDWKNLTFVCVLSFYLRLYYLVPPKNKWPVSRNIIIDLSVDDDELDHSVKNLF